MEWEEGDIADVTTRSGDTFTAEYTLAPGIDYFWRPLERVKVNFLIDPVVHATRVQCGTVSSGAETAS